ncbi:hypothetical protein [Microbulbifer epialgicus]|uniref:Uncharacterized protein n=1 Tax=Microbulbifer epialgicus TaxID=393907 RepID=A0ABV4P0G1_9GAMM
MNNLIFIGAGDVVTTFVQRYPDYQQSYHITILGRSELLGNSQQSLQRIQSLSNSITFYCCSTDEGELLKHCRERSRREVTKENLKITEHLLKQGYLGKGPIFVLTNPSEVTAEYIYRRTQNPHIYALGLDVDLARYRRIMATYNLKDSPTDELLGLHYLGPVPKFYRTADMIALRHQIDTPDEVSVLHRLSEQLEDTISSEFIGCRPPVLSGAQAIDNTLRAIAGQSSCLVSGLDDHTNAFVGGRLCTQAMSFSPCYPESVAEQHFFNNALAGHKAFMTELEPIK